MGRTWAVDTLEPARLDSESRAAWAAFRDADPALRSPYFDLRYALAAGEAAPGAEVAVISRGGRIAAFLPFQRRGKLIQPIAAPMTDYHGPIAAPGVELQLEEVVAALGASRFRYSALVGRPPACSHEVAMVADLTDGLDAYLARRAPGFLKDKRRRARRLEEDHGPLAFRLTDDADAALDFIVALKREQLRRTGQHDLFSSPWVPRLIEALERRGEPDFGLRFAVLSAGGRTVAAELGLRSGDAYHLWFPVYDPGFARYSPGALMTLETIRAAAAQGVRMVDFGPGREAYKADFAEPGLPVVEGEAVAGALERSARRAARRVLGRAPALREAGVKLNRRWDRITACEPGLDRRLGAATRSIGAIARRRPAASLGVGLGLGLGAGLAATLLSE
ncbi:MAG: GNAT family N-acetyltransferase [Phenylobacterium sp.]|uniref:GNAT family N-acetyltransferase n=1 Tax=Phenylobacterium sp. TaxID=1871053 RepID=UPI0039197241